MNRQREATITFTPTARRYITGKNDDVTIYLEPRPAADG